MEVNKLNFKKWLYLFFTTLLIGGVASVIAALGLYIVDDQIDFWGTFVFNIGAGFMFSVVSQMGFFAYLMVNYIAKGFIRRREIWATLQWIIIVVVAVDVVYLKWLTSENQQLVTTFIILTICLLICAFVVALWKSQLTNKHAFTPTFFFMFVATILETVPAFREGEISAIWFMILPLFVCNAWQIMNLHRLVQTKQEN